MTRESSFMPSEFEPIFWPKKALPEIQIPLRRTDKDADWTESPREASVPMRGERVTEKRAARPTVRDAEVRAVERAKAEAERAARNQARYQEIYAACEQRDGALIDRLGGMFSVPRELVLNIFTFESWCNPDAVNPYTHIGARGRGQITNGTWNVLVSRFPVLRGHRNDSFGQMGGSIALLRLVMDEMLAEWNKNPTLAEVAARYHGGNPSAVGRGLLADMRAKNPTVASAQKDPKSVESYFAAAWSLMFQAYPEMGQRTIDLTALPQVDRLGFQLAAADFPLRGNRKTPTTMVASLRKPAPERVAPPTVEIDPVVAMTTPVEHAAVELASAEISPLSPVVSGDDERFPEVGVRTFSLEPHPDYGEAVAIAPTEAAPVMVAEAPQQAFTPEETQIVAQLELAHAQTETAPPGDTSLTVPVLEVPPVLTSVTEIAAATESTAPIVPLTREVTALSPHDPVMMAGISENTLPTITPVDSSAKPLTQEDFFMTASEQATMTASAKLINPSPTELSYESEGEEATLSSSRQEPLGAYVVAENHPTGDFIPDIYGVNVPEPTQPFSPVLRSAGTMRTSYRPGDRAQIARSIPTSLSSRGVRKAAYSEGVDVPQGNSRDIMNLYMRKSPWVSAMVAMEGFTENNIPHEARFLDLLINAPSRRDGYARSCAVMRGGEWIVPAGAWGNKTGAEMPLSIYFETLKKRWESTAYTAAYIPHREKDTYST